MTQTELNAKVHELQKLKAISDQLAEVIESLKDEIKTEMLRRKTDSLSGVEWQITWKEYTTTRLDKDRLEADFGDLSKYKKSTTYKRFCLKKRDVICC